MDGFRYEDGNRWTKDKCTLCQCKVSMRIRVVLLTKLRYKNRAVNLAYYYSEVCFGLLFTSGFQRNLLGINQKQEVPDNFPYHCKDLLMSDLLKTNQKGLNV